MNNIKQMLDDIERIKHEANMKIKNLQAQLDKSQEQQKEATARVMLDNGDQVAQEQMRNAETNIDKEKHEIAQFRKKAMKKLNEKRQLLENQQNKELDEMTSSLAEMRTQQETLQNELIPQAQTMLEEYAAEKKKLETEILTTTSKMNELRQFQIERSLSDIN